MLMYDIYGCSGSFTRALGQFYSGYHENTGLDTGHQRTSDLCQSMDFGKVTFCQILHLLGMKTGPKHHGTPREASYMH